jgi:hypothetical protein
MTKLPYVRSPKIEPSKLARTRPPRNDPLDKFARLASDLVVGPMGKLPTRGADDHFIQSITFALTVNAPM